MLAKRKQVMTVGSAVWIALGRVFDGLSISPETMLSYEKLVSKESKYRSFGWQGIALTLSQPEYAQSPA
jgi:hypothetical protein